MKIIKGYKFIEKDMKSRFGKHQWELGKWYKVDEDKIKLCDFGFHACEEPIQALDYIYGDKFFLVEARGKVLKKEDDKFVASEMRLIKELPINPIFKRLAIFSAKQCLKNYEKEYSNDSRVSDCIKAAEDYLDGKISLKDLNAAESAAESAARSAARSTARSAARSAESAAESAAWSAESAARSAAWSAARSAARSAESAAESAQNKFLKDFIKKYLRNTPNKITTLKKEEIFIFGSNKAGRHGAGAAKLAKDKFCAEGGIGEGLTGKSYAFPTLDENLKKLTIKQIKNSVKKLNKCAKENPDKIFLLTKVGCGLAGYDEEEIKELFKEMELNIIKPKGW